MKLVVGHSLGRRRAVALLSSLPRGKRKSETMQINGKKEERLGRLCHLPLTHALDLCDSKQKQETARSLLFRLITLSTPLLQLDREWILDAKPRSGISLVAPWHMEWNILYRHTQLQN